MSKSLINLDNDSTAILKLNKAELEKSALNLKSSLDTLTEYEALYKLQHLIKYRMEFIKELAVETFIEKFKGSQSEKDNGFTVTLKNSYEYSYSEYVKVLEKQIKKLQEEVKKEKDKQRESARGKSKGESIALTLH
jgi:hypothetical protein